MPLQRFPGDENPPSRLAIFVGRALKERIAEFHNFKARYFQFPFCYLRSQLVMFRLFGSGQRLMDVPDPLHENERSARFQSVPDMAQYRLMRG